VKRLLCWRRRSCIVGLIGVNAAGADGEGAVIAFQSSPCLWKKRLHRWRRRNWRQKRRDEGDGEGMLVSLLCFRLFMLFPSARPCLALVFVMSLLRRHGCCCCGARWRLQLGEWLNLFLVAVGAGHGSAEVVLLAAGIFRGRPV